VGVTERNMHCGVIRECIDFSKLIGGVCFVLL